VPEIEVSTSKMSKLGKESSKVTNELSESKEQLPFADTVSKVNTFFVSFIEQILYRVCFGFAYFLLSFSKQLSSSKNIFSCNNLD